MSVNSLFKFDYYVNEILSETKRGELIIAFDKAGLRPEKIEFHSIPGQAGFLIISLHYTIQGSDHFNTAANGYKFQEEKIEPVLRWVLKGINYNFAYRR